MAYTIKKSVNEIVGLLKKNPSPTQKSQTIWDTLKDQVEDEGTWDEKLIKSVEKNIGDNLDKIPEENLRDMWEDTSVAADTFDDPESIPMTKIKEDLTEEILNSIMDKVGESYGYGDDDREETTYSDEEEEDFEDDDVFDKKIRKTFKDPDDIEDDDFNFDDDSFLDEEDEKY